jgi:hypothetical protein
MILLNPNILARSSPTLIAIASAIATEETYGIVIPKAATYFPSKSRIIAPAEPEQESSWKDASTLTLTYLDIDFDHLSCPIGVVLLLAFAALAVIASIDNLHLDRGGTTSLCVQRRD